MQKIINEILKANNIKLKTIVKIDSVNNLVCLINNQYVLRIRTKTSKKEFLRSSNILNLLNKNKIKVPKLIKSSKMKNKDYYIYKIIEGDRLFCQWHKLNNKKRKNIIKDICNTIKEINNIRYNPNFKKFNLTQPNNWKQKITNSINKKLNYALNNKILTKKEYNDINNFCKQNYFTLYSTPNYLSYIDLHFGNIIIKNNKFQGIIDFDDVNYYPLDYQLTTIYKFAKQPKLFAFKEDEKLIKQKDYAKILVWFKKYYPELFKFKYSNSRQRIYSIEYDLRLLKDWPNSKTLRKRLFDNIK